MVSEVRDNPAQSRFELDAGAELAVGYYLHPYRSAAFPFGSGDRLKARARSSRTRKGRGAEGGRQMSLYLGFHFETPGI